LATNISWQPTLPSLSDQRKLKTVEMDLYRKNGFYGGCRPWNGKRDRAILHKFWTRVRFLDQIRLPDTKGELFDL
jgi:hypothetical protein